MIAGARDETGAAVVLGLLWIGILLAIGAACALAVGVIAQHRQAQASADLAALAGAQAHQRGEVACAVARSVAASNGASLTSCHLLGADVAVSVSVSVLDGVGAGLSLPARARAGPSGLGGPRPADLS